MRHKDEQKLNVIVTLFPYVMQMYHKKRNPKVVKNVRKAFIT